MKIGYARINNKQKSFDNQVVALRRFGCQIIYKEIVGLSLKTERPELNKMIKELKESDQLVIWKLDRLGKSIRDLIELSSILNAKKVALISLNDPIDTTTSQGMLYYNLMVSLSEFEKAIIKESLNPNPNLGGRPKGLTSTRRDKAYKAKKLYEAGLPVKEISKKLDISRTTFYTYLSLIKEGKI